MREINKLLYESLLALCHNHTNNGGKVEYSEEDYSYIEDTLDLIEVKYFDNKPDGANQERIWDEGGPLLTDQEAYVELTTRFNNTTINKFQ